MGDTVNVSRVFRKQSLYASVIRSCRKCGAPGYWHNVPDVNMACYAPEKVTQLGSDPVGAICPNCGADREEIEPLGEIWRREWKVSLWSLLKDIAGNIFKPRKELT
jgi:hypothetical protein